MAQTVDRLTPEGKRFFEELEKLKKLQVRVGLQHGDSIEEGVDVMDVAMWNELGTVNAPSRPFLRKSVDENADKISSFVKAQLVQMTKGKSTEDVLKAIGAMQKGLIQEKITGGEYEPNAPSTVKKKGSDKPLIDTGRMRQSVNFYIRPKGER